MDRTSILYTPLAKRWHLLHAKKTWLVQSPVDAGVLCGYFPITVTKNDDLGSVPDGRLVIVKAMETSIRLNYVDFQGKPIDGYNEETLDISPIPKGHITCEDGLHSDGWLEVTSIFKYNRIGSIEFQVYLPEANQNTPKQVSLIINDTDINQVALRRGKLTQFKANIPSDQIYEGTISLKMDSREVSTNSGDQRDLGAVLVKINVDDTGWTKIDDTGWI